MAFTFNTIPQDIIGHIFQFLPIESVYNLCLTERSTTKMFNSRAFIRRIYEPQFTELFANLVITTEPRVSLYYAEWCHHSMAFMPEWNKLEILCNEKNITYGKYCSDITQLGRQIVGYPTILVDGAEYSGCREATAIFAKLESNKSTSELVPPFKKMITKIVLLTHNNLVSEIAIRHLSENYTKSQLWTQLSDKVIIKKECQKQLVDKCVYDCILYNEKIETQTTCTLL